MIDINDGGLFMTLKFYTLYDGKLLDTWNDYPIIPNVGDGIDIKNYQYEVSQRIFFKNCIHIIII